MRWRTPVDETRPYLLNVEQFRQFQSTDRTASYGNPVRLSTLVAEYGVTGINTLIDSREGVAYQKDFGPDSPKVFLKQTVTTQTRRGAELMINGGIKRFARLWSCGVANRKATDTQIATEESVNARRIVRTGLCVAIIAGCSAVAQTKPAPTQTPPAASGSPAAKVGLFVYPQKQQTPEQQATDESACYSSAQQQTGIDPAVPPPPPEQAQQQKGGAVKGAAKGAAGGAAIGAIADDAGTGAAVGATAGAVHGRRQQKKANKQAEQQAQQQAQAQQQQRLDTFRRAFSACMDSKAYSVK
jgi:hypothetical protein